MAQIFMRFPGGLSKALTLSYDDGVEQDIRLVSILNAHGIKCTFNINTGNYTPDGKVFPEGQIHRVMSRKRAIETYSESGHELAVHTLTHPWLEQMTSDRVIYEIMRDRENIENDFGNIARGMAYPFGTYSDEVVDAARACGIVYSRTTRSTFKFDMPTDWMRLPATCHHSHPGLMELCDKFIDMPYKREPQMFYLWGHSFEFEANNDWHIIEEFAKKMGGRDDIWYATNIEIYDYTEDFGRIRFSADGKRLHNPSARTLYYMCYDKVFSIAPGETRPLV